MTQPLITRLSKLDAPDREVTQAEREQYRKEYREAVRNCWKDATLLRAKEASNAE
ncbi:hypothetical protein L3V16_06035 [Brucella ciceri]|uniref:hypothetical protein n=1 Tax=Brucella ciceri TaxID=391287 RepID=UPI001F149393|nr:hypothetical protein [Brucella ciceri]MCH6203398.1 hypothetical protein [Brucella ciceri]